MKKIKETFDIVYNETYHNTFKYVVLKTDNISNVEDIMQDIYVSLYKIMEKKGAEYIDNYNSFVIKLAKNELFKYYSLKSKLKFLLKKEKEEELDLTENIKDEKVDVFQEVSRNIETKIIWDFIEREDLITQKIMAFYYLEDLKISKIADLLNMKESSVKNKIYRTIDKIKKNFKYGGV